MHTLYTYGYQGTDPSVLKGWGDAGVVIADIRYKPVSRNFIWNKSRLSAQLGTRYVHLMQLGNENFKMQNGPFIQICDAPEGIRILGKLLEKSPVMILCVCSDLPSCHRKTVSDLAIKEWPGITITHLTKNAVPEGSGMAPAGGRTLFDES